MGPNTGMRNPRHNESEAFEVAAAQAVSEDNQGRAPTLRDRLYRRLQLVEAEAAMVRRAIALVEADAGMESAYDIIRRAEMEL